MALDNFGIRYNELLIISSRLCSSIVLMWISIRFLGRYGPMRSGHSIKQRCVCSASIRPSSKHSSGDVKRYKSQCQSVPLGKVYSCTNVNVGLGTIKSRSPAKAWITRRINVVLPAPRSPHKATIPVGGSVFAKLSAKASNSGSVNWCVIVLFVMNQNPKQYAKMKNPMEITKLFARDDVFHIITAARLSVITQIANMVT